MADILKPLAVAAQLAIVVGIAYTAWAGFRFFAWGPEPLAGVDAGPRLPEVRRSKANIEQITGMHLFGRPPAGVGAVGSTENLAVTRLALQLVGVFVADAPEASIAFIAQQGRPAKLYRIEDMVPGNARLMAVQRDLVVLLRGGARERLPFDESKTFIKPVAASATSADAARGIAKAAAEPSPVAAIAAAASDEATPSTGSRAALALAEFRERVEREPDRVLDELGLEASSQGGESGYLVGALAERPELSHAGLQRGDRILAVNGRPLGDPRQDGRRLEDIVAQGSASLEIQRGERRFTVTFSLD